MFYYLIVRFYFSLSLFLSSHDLKSNLSCFYVNLSFFIKTTFVYDSVNDKCDTLYHLTLFSCTDMIKFNDGILQ